jgi:PIN domain nuclease of toxin-antitoxin system
VTVLDSSAVLALLQREPGADLVQRALRGSVMSAANLAEVVAKLVDAGKDASNLRAVLAASGVAIEPVLEADAELAGSMRSLKGGRSLSLGDRCCLALTLRTKPAVVLTGDRAWAKLDLPIKVELLR